MTRVYAALPVSVCFSSASAFADVLEEDLCVSEQGLSNCSSRLKSLKVFSSKCHSLSPFPLYLNDRPFHLKDSEYLLCQNPPKALIPNRAVCVMVKMRVKEMNE